MEIVHKYYGNISTAHYIQYMEYNVKIEINVHYLDIY